MSVDLLVVPPRSCRYAGARARVPALISTLVTASARACAHLYARHGQRTCLRSSIRSSWPARTPALISTLVMASALACAHLYARHGSAHAYAHLYARHGQRACLRSSLRSSWPARMPAPISTLVMASIWKAKFNIASFL